MTDPLDDFEHLNLIARYRNRLDDILDWYRALPDTMLTISSHAMDLAGTRGTTSRIPGGDALAMLGPWSADADHGDDLPHPAQTIHEWVETINGTAHRTLTENWRWLRDHVPHILESPWATAWREDIDALWHRLERLSGDAPRTEQEHRGPEHCQAVADEIPDDFRLTAKDADLFWPGIEQKLKDDRHHKRPVPDRAADRTYAASDLREYLARRSCAGAGTMAT